MLTRDLVPSVYMCPLYLIKGSSYYFVMRYCLCQLCVHILSLVHVVSLDICEVKIVAQACIQKISELPTGIEPVSPDCKPKNASQR